MAINWHRRKYTQDQLRDAVAASESWRGVARELGVKNLNAGGVYLGIKAAVHELNLDTSHFTGQGWNKGDTFGLARINTIPLEDILVENSTYLNTSNLKKRLLKASLLENKCYAPFCPVPNPTVDPFTGVERELKFSLDHINGNRLDNRIENLRLLCYHCHGMTDTYGVGNKTRYNRNKSGKITGVKKSKKSPSSHLCACGNSIKPQSTRCLGCEHKSRKGRKGKTVIEWPSRDEVQQMVRETNYVKTGEALGVSDNAVRKFLKRTA